jgi:hypothetical protein
MNVISPTGFAPNIQPLRGNPGGIGDAFDRYSIKRNAAKPANIISYNYLIILFITGLA